MNSYWNYRIIDCDAGKNIDKDKKVEPCFIIAEVYYENDVPYAWCDAKIYDETIDGLKRVYERINDAFKKPILYESDFGGIDGQQENCDDIVERD